MNKKTEIIYGRHSVLELLKVGKRQINKLLISNTVEKSFFKKILFFAKQKGITINKVPMNKLRKISKNSQGIIAEVSPIKFIPIKDLINKHSIQRLVLLDNINDPNNLGAIIRNCVVFGIDGVILPKKHTVGINQTVAKTSVGAIEYIAISKVPNINQIIYLLKKKGFLIVGIENGYNKLSINNNNLSLPIAIIFGSESKGIHFLTKKRCDLIISIQQKNDISSLNVSCASAIILHELFKIFPT